MEGGASAAVNEYDRGHFFRFVRPVGKPEIGEYFRQLSLVRGARVLDCGDISDRVFFIDRIGHLCLRLGFQRRVGFARSVVRAVFAGLRAVGAVRRVFPAAGQSERRCDRQQGGHENSREFFHLVSFR